MIINKGTDMLGGGTLLFRAFRVYTVKELDSHAKHGQSFKKQFGRITEYFWTKNLPPDSYKFRRVIFRSWLFMT